MMKNIPPRVRRALTTSTLLLLALLAASIPVYASLYTVPISIVESAGNDYLYLPIIVDMPVEWMIDQGFITRDDARDTRIETSGGIEQLHSVADDKILVYVPSLTADTGLNWWLTTDNDPLSYYNIMVGYGGNITVNDDASLELGASFNWSIRAFVDTRAGPGKFLVYKEDAFKIYVNAEDSINVAILGAGDSESIAVNATGLTPNIYTIDVQADGTSFNVTIDGTLIDNELLAGNSTPNNGNDWYFALENSMPYVEYIKLET